jgi:hypothetical protein
VGVPVAEQHANNGLNIVGTHGLAGHTPQTPSQPFTANATQVPTIVNVGGDGGGGSGGGDNRSGCSISLSTTRSSSMSTRLSTIPSFHNLGARCATGNSTPASSSVHIDKRAHEKCVKKFTHAQFLCRILKKWRSLSQ